MLSPSCGPSVKPAPLSEVTGVYDDVIKPSDASWEQPHSIDVRCVGQRVGLTPLLPVLICGTQHFAVIDNAAQISMPSQTMVADLGLLSSAVTYPTITIKNAEDDSYMHCVVLSMFSFEIAGDVYKHTFAVGPITDDVISVSTSL